ncbi:putative NTE family protein [Aquicella siphonis]|uniref:Putative NTE family protein n=1 Tax=Aquicella siphonis TaxID=254247 RepID=A0A5E4PGD0_9COXI|nr:cyclic nucleotide-binding domain-containing protein [Aquicella siphonis]VVC75695.1 putative NTE family protein [Aquicella siphonis]
MDESADLTLRIQLVKKQPVFSQLTDKETEELASLFSEKKVASEQTIVKEGDPVDSIYLIASGTADVRHVTIKDNAPVVNSVAILSSGDAIGLNETGFYSISGKRTATVVAMTDMVLYRLSVAAFHGFALAHSHVSDIMHKHAENILNEKF